MKLLFILLLGLGFTQTKLETRVYTIENISIMSGVNYEIDINQILGFDIDYAIVTPIGAEYVSGTGNFTAYIIGAFQEVAISLDTYGNWHNPSADAGDLIIYSDNLYWLNENIYDNNLHIMNSGLGALATFDLTLSITAEFPEEDTGYIEEGFEFCVSPGANLLSFPCDNPISVEESLPSGIENFITSIIGEGVATSYNPALGWIGNLEEFDPGSGYWFKSNESLCFEYECVEN